MNIDLVVRERMPLAVLRVGFDVNGVVQEIGVVFGTQPPEDPTAGLLREGKVGGLPGLFTRRSIYKKDGVRNEVTFLSGKQRLLCGSSGIFAM